MEMARESFAVLMPICVKVANKPTKENACELREVLRRVSCQGSSLQAEALQTYILFPLELHLKSGKAGFETRRYLIDCMLEVIQHTHITSLGKLLDLYTLLFIQIFDKERPGFVADVSEELKCSVLNCAIELLKNASPELTLELYDRQNFRKLTQSIFMCAHLTHAERSRAVRLSAIGCIMAVAQVHDEADSRNMAVRQRVGDTLMFVLPGILHGLMQAIHADDNQGHKVTMMALRAWSRILTVVMEDGESKTTDETKPDFSSSRQTERKEDRSSPLKENWLLREPVGEGEGGRTADWLRAAAERLAPQASNLSALRDHPHWLVRRELVTACSLLLSRCSTNLSPCAVQLLEYLVALSEDDSDKVAEDGRRSVEAFSLKCEGKLLETLEENFFGLVTKLPRVVRSANEGEQLAALRLLAGYLRLLGSSNLPGVLSSASHLHRLAMTLIHVVELDCSAASLLDEHSLRDLTDPTSEQVIGLGMPWRRLKHFSDRRALEKMEEICGLLCRLGDLAAITDRLLDLFRTGALHRNETVLLLNEIVGRDAENSPRTLQVVKNVLDAYLEPSTWYVPTSAGEGADLTNAELHGNLVLACLLVEGVGKMAATLGRNFDGFLLRTLYLVLERAGSSNGLLAQAGMGATQRLAEAGGHRSVTRLVCRNVDYFSYHVTMRLRRVERNPGVLDVLNVVMKHSNLDVLPCMREIVNDVLLQSCDTFQDRSTLAFLRVFHTFVCCIHRWLGSAPCADAHKPRSTIIEPKKNQGLEDLRRELIEYQQAKRRIREFLDDDQEEIPEDGEETLEEDVEFNEEPETEMKVPGHIQMTVAILTRCLHFLPSGDKQQKLVVLETMDAGVRVLANWEDQLLPVVHLIWSPLIGRFTDVSEPLLINRSFHLLCTLANTARDFIHSRTLKQVLPSLLSFLKSSATESRRKDVGSAYRHTQKYKLQHELLDRLGQLCVDISLQGKQLDDVLFTVVPYLGTLQPAPLQCCCVKLFKTVAAYDADAVWLKIYSLVEPSEVLPSSEQYLVSGYKTCSKVNKNAVEILQFLKDNGL